MTAPRPGSALPARARAGRRAAGIALAVALLAGPVEVKAGGERGGPAASDFAAFVNAWQGRNAAAIRRLIPEKERVTLDLEGTGDGRVSGRPTAENAEAVLKEYFAKVETPTLKDVSPEDARTETRSFDYTYRPTGAETRTTTLSVTLRLSGGAYVLREIRERVRKP
jgi:hypothetical protein